MPVLCPECGQEMMYEPATKMYACKKCGLYVNYNQLRKLMEEKRNKEQRDPRREYLNWWLSDKKSATNG